MSEVQYWEGRFRDILATDTSNDFYEGWVQYDSEEKNFEFYQYKGDSSEGDLQTTINCAQIKPIKTKPKEKYFAFKYTEDTWFEGTTEPVYEMTFGAHSRDKALEFREFVKEKCLELPVVGRYPKRNNPEPHRDGTKPDAVVARRCDICNIVCSGIESYDAHIKGAQHKKNSAKVKYGIPIAAKPGPKIYYCDVCEIDCTGDEPWESHLNGAPHKKKAARALETNVLPEKTARVRFYCDVCDVDAYDESQLKIHLAGRPHQKKLLGEQHFYCHICKVTATNPEQLRIHKEGKPHKKKEARYMYAKENQGSSLVNLRTMDGEDLINLKQVENGMDELDLDHRSEDDAEQKELGHPEDPDECDYQWQVGEVCKAHYAEDGEYYECTIDSIDEANDKCWVLFHGYENDGPCEVDLKDIIKNDENDNCEHFYEHVSSNEEIFYNWEKGDVCWALNKDDGQYYQCTVLETYKDTQKCLVSYNGYDLDAEIDMKDMYNEEDWDD